MQIIKPSYEILTPINGVEILKFLEKIIRVCYKSEEKISDDSYILFLQKIIERGHEAMLEHFSFSVKFICDRGISHELVRHRVASFAQESTRYCNYGSDKKGMTFIQPCWFDMDITGDYKVDWISDEECEFWDPYKLFPQAENDHEVIQWLGLMAAAENAYSKLSEANWTPEKARSILPNSLKTEIVVTANIREWRHILQLRTAKTAHPQMRELMIPLLNDLNKKIPIIFDDLMPCEV